MERKATMFTTVTSAVLAAGIILYYPVLIDSGTDDDMVGLNFVLLLIPGLAAVVPIVVSALVNVRFGRRDRWVPSVACASVVVAAVLLLEKGGGVGNLAPTAAVVITIFVAASVVSTWGAERFGAGVVRKDLSDER